MTLVTKDDLKSIRDQLDRMEDKIDIKIDSISYRLVKLERIVFGCVFLLTVMGGLMQTGLVDIKFKHDTDHQQIALISTKEKDN